MSSLNLANIDTANTPCPLYKEYMFNYYTKEKRNKHVTNKHIIYNILYTFVRCWKYSKGMQKKTFDGMHKRNTLASKKLT